MGCESSTARNSNTPRVKENPTIVDGSTEVFDKLCDVCKNPEKEAVGFCRLCEQNYCKKCRHCDKKNESRETNPGARKQKRTSLFKRQLVPVSVQSIPVGYRNVNKDFRSSVTCLALSELSGDIFIVDKQDSGTMLKVLKKDGSTIAVPSALRYSHMLVCDQSSKAKTSVYCSTAFTQVHMACIEASTLKQYKYFENSGKCYGIAQFDNGFALSVLLVTGFDLPDCQIQYLDSQGKIKKQIYYGKDGKALFSGPEYLASNRTHDILYVSDIGKKAVIALNVHGDVIYTFRHSDLKRPMAMTVDDEDNVYVANGENVIQIYKSGTKHRVLVKTGGHGTDILSVCFNPVAQSLIVGENSNKLKIFNFLP